MWSVGIRKQRLRHSFQYDHAMLVKIRVELMYQKTMQYSLKEYKSN